MRDTGALSPERLARDVCFPAVAEAVPRAASSFPGTASWTAAKLTIVNASGNETASWAAASLQRLRGRAYRGFSYDPVHQSPTRATALHESDSPASAVVDRSPGSKRGRDSPGLVLEDQRLVLPWRARQEWP